jgi:hypothetical protein
MGNEKANIEIMDFWSPRENVTVWRLGIILYTAARGGPELGIILGTLLDNARAVLQKPYGGTSWWYSMAVGRHLIVAAVGGRNTPRFYPATKPVPSQYLWRIFLNEGGLYELVCYRVSYTRRTLDSMTILDWHRAAKRQ